MKDSTFTKLRETFDNGNRTDDDGMCVRCGVRPARVAGEREDTCVACHDAECGFDLLDDGTCTMFWH